MASVPSRARGQLRYPVLRCAELDPCGSSRARRESSHVSGTALALQSLLRDPHPDDSGGATRTHAAPPHPLPKPYCVTPPRTTNGIYIRPSANSIATPACDLRVQIDRMMIVLPPAPGGPVSSSAPGSRPVPRTRRSSPSLPSGRRLMPELDRYAQPGATSLWPAHH